MKNLALTLFGLVALWNSGLCSHEKTTDTCGVTLVLIGSNGDLSKRYLWPAIFNNFCKGSSAVLNGGCELVVYGSITRKVENRSQVWSETTVNVECPTSLPDAGKECQRCIDQFRNAVQYVQLRDEYHYQQLSALINEYYLQKHQKEVGRIFYLAVPPSAYSTISKNVHNHARLSDGWTRVVFEKPFGEDLLSAQQLADSLSKYFAEDEIYRVDHYLGKFGVQQILPFRSLNEYRLSHMWNSRQISRVEIAMLEKLDVAGRSKFYDSYGVIRDIFQNHLTEMLVQVAVDLPALDSSDKSDYLKAKSELLSVVYPPHINRAILGQYLEYQRHLEQDGMPQNPNNGSRTPTYASVLMLIGSPKWREVPFILTSGKQLGRRSAYARVVFKDKSFSLLPKKSLCPPEIIFLVQDEELRNAGILFSEHFSNVDFELPFKDLHSWSTEKVLFPPAGSSNCHYIFMHPEDSVASNAYISLIKALVDGEREMFVDTESLLRSWILWTPLLKEIQVTKPSVYLYDQDTLGALDFQLINSNLVATASLKVFDQDAVNIIERFDKDHKWSNLFGIPTYVMQEYELGSLLAEHIYSRASQSIKEHGAFHLALPGGSSPRPFLQNLVLNYQYLFPWQQTQIWQTDEWCVQNNSTNSNIHQLSKLLLSLSPILYPMVHRMPVEMVRGVCIDEDHGPLLYERHLLEYGNHGQLHYILLGLGEDGHVASLFPADAVFTTIGEPYVSTVMLKESYPVEIKQRMTLTFKTILQARHIGLLITSGQKTEILNELHRCFLRDDRKECEDLPVFKLLKSVERGQATIYIDAQIQANAN